MSTYVKPGKPLEFDNAPDWLVAHLRYRRTVLDNTPKSVRTFFVDLRGFYQWLSMYKETGRQPKDQEELSDIDILALPLSAAIAVTKEDIETYLYFLTDVLDNGVATRNKKLAAISSFYDYLIDQREALGLDIKENPARRIRRPRMPKQLPTFLPDDDQRSFLNAICGENAARDYAFFLLLLSAGLRISEATNIDVADLNLKSQILRIRGAKGKKDRVAYLTDPCCEALARYLREYRQYVKNIKDDALFVSSRRSARLTDRSMQKAMDKYCLAAGLSGLNYTPHKLRHTMATTLAKSGADLLVIQEALGHENPVTTEKYTHLDSSDIAKAINRSSLSRLGSAYDD